MAKTVTFDDAPSTKAADSGKYVKLDIESNPTEISSKHDKIDVADSENEQCSGNVFQLFRFLIGICICVAVALFVYWILNAFFDK